MESGILLDMLLKEVTDEIHAALDNDNSFMFKDIR